MWSAYSAYLVTSFVAKPKEITIKSFADLDKNKNFQVGILNSISATLLTIRTSEDRHMRAVSSKLNVSGNMTEHMRKLLAGDYAFIDGTGLLLSEYDHFPNHTDIRYYSTNDLNFMYPSFLGIPTDVFYKETLVKILTNFDENGTLERLRAKYLNIDSSTLLDTGKISDDNKSVTLKRIGLLLFSTCGSVLLSVLILMCEHIFNRCMA